MTWNEVIQDRNKLFRIGGWEKGSEEESEAFINKTQKGKLKGKKAKGKRSIYYTRKKKKEEKLERGNIQLKRERESKSL